MKNFEDVAYRYVHFWLYISFKKVLSGSVDKPVRAVVPELKAEAERVLLSAESRGLISFEEAIKAFGSAEL